jgi:Domain of unknown function (DUF4157)
MFAPPVAKRQAKTGARSTGKLAPQRATLVARPFGGGAVEQAHARIGNQATLRLLARRASSLIGNEPHGDNEQEADPAILTVRGATPGVSWDFSKISVLSPLTAPPLPGGIQAKLAVGPVDDPLEHEADRVADQVVRMPDPGLSLPSTAAQINRKCSGCEGDDVEAQRLRMKQAITSGAQTGEPPCIVHDVLQSPGQPLDVPTRAYFEPRFGYDFSGVRVHTDGRAAASAASIGASAYTAGSNIAFATGRYDPATSFGRRLLAHELAHVVQQHLAHQNGAFSGPSIIQRDADSDDYRQGYQDGLNGDESHAVPRAGDRLTDSNEGYAKGHHEFSQKTVTPEPTPDNVSPTQASPAASGQSQDLADEKGNQSVYEATRNILTDFIMGTKEPAHVFGPSHPWTVKLQSHPHMVEVRKRIRDTLVKYCRVTKFPWTEPGQRPRLSGIDNFNLNTLSAAASATWLFKDALNWATWGKLGQENAYLFGSFRLGWSMGRPHCEDGLGSTLVNFYAWDVAHLGSAIRIPKTNIPLLDIGDQPLGKEWPLNDVTIAWVWSMTFISDYGPPSTVELTPMAR